MREINYWTTFCVCVLTTLFLTFVWRRRRLLYYGSKISGPSMFRSFVLCTYFLGGTKNILKNVIQVLEVYGPLFKLWMGHKLMVVVTRPNDIDAVLSSALDKIDDYKFLTPAYGDGLITLPAKDWRKHRKVIGLTFNQQILNTFVDTFGNYSNILIKRLEETIDKGYVDMFPILSQCTLDIVCDTTLGVKINAMREGSDYVLWTSRAAELGIMRIFNVFLHPDYIWRLTSMSKETQSISKKLHDHAQEIIKTKRYQIATQNPNLKTNGGVKKKIFLDYLLEITDNDCKWSNEEVSNETRTIIVAGSDATALTLGYVLMILGMHQEIQEKVYEEISSVFENSTGRVSVEDLQEMPYLERVIKETLRLFPVASVIARQAAKDIVLEDSTRIPEGSSIAIPILYIHRDPEIWPDPLKFNPDRFLPEEASQRNAYSYLPFSGGPRNCIGYRYAMMAMKTVLSTILRHYKVVATEYKCVSDVELKLDVATKCVGGQKVQLQSRF